MSNKRGNGSGSIFKRQADGAYFVAWYDATGKRHTQSTRTSDAATARRYLARMIDAKAQRTLGLIDTKAEGFAESGKQAIAEHLDAWAEALTASGATARHVDL